MIAELEAIKKLFFEEWDPIGVRDFPEATGEYDSYAMEVFGLLHKEATIGDIADYLNQIEAEHMGLSKQPYGIAKSRER